MPMDDIAFKVGQMLAKMESTDSDAERDMIYQRVQVLASRHGIDLARARQAQQQRERREQPTMKMVKIGEKRGRHGQKGLSYFVDLFLEIARRNDVKCDIASTKTAVFAYGFPSDIEMIEMLYASLVARMVHDADEYLKIPREPQPLWVKKKVPNPDYGRYYGEPKFLYEEGFVTKPLPAATARRNFYEAFTQRISARLAEARRQAIAEAKAEEQELLQDAAAEQEPHVSTDLVLLRKDEEVRDFYKTKSNARGSYRGATAARHDEKSRAAGRDSADSAHLGRSDRELPGPRKQLG